MESDVTKAHLWFEEWITGDPYIDLKKDFFQPLAELQDLVLIAMKGGKTNLGWFKPLEPGEFKSRLGEFNKKINLFITIANSRSKASEAERKPGSELDEEFDRVFEDILAISDLASKNILLIIHEDEKSLAWVNRGIFLTILIVFGLLITVILRNRAYLQTRNLELEKKAEIQAKRVIQLGRQNEMILTHAGEGIYGLDLEGKTTFCNPAAAQMIGYEIEELIGKPQHATVHHTRADGSPYPREECPVYAALKDGTVHHVSDEVFWRKDGSSFPVDYVSTPIIEDDKIIGAVVTFKDITSQRESENSLKESQEFSNDILLNIHDPVITINEKGIILSVNDATITMFGNSHEELLGKNVKMLMPEPFWSEHDQYLKRYLQTGISKIIGIGREVVGYHKDGSTFPMDLAITVSHLKGERIFIGVLRNISEEKQQKLILEKKIQERTSELQKTAQELIDFIDTANAPIFGVDTQGNINEWNQKVAEITGFSKDEVLGKNLVQTRIREEYQDSVQTILQDALKGKETSNYEVPLYSREGKRVLILLNATTKRNAEGHIIGVVGIGQDITELDSYRESLLSKVDEKTRELGKTLEIAEDTNLRLLEANRHKSQFLSSMSHELRTPLNGILGFIDLLKGTHFGPLNETQLDFASQIEDSGKHLLDLISDLLDVAKIDAGAMELDLENCLPQDCFPEVLGMIKPQLDQKRLQLKSLIDPSVTAVVCDIRRVKQIMVNLLSNAIKFTTENGTIEVKIFKENGLTKIMVSDTGIGISEKDQKIIFDEFAQADRVRDEALGGVGIGLALSRRLVELHGGEIGVESKEGKGSTFWFTLPHKELPQKTKEIQKGKSETDLDYPRARRILVVEDNQINLEMILYNLKVHEHEVFVARNGKEAVDRAQSILPELILMDIRMPVMNGLEATQRLRAMPDFPHIPIIALTASVGEDSEIKCLAAGCTDYLAKPIQSAELFDMLKQYLKPTTTSTDAS